MAIENTNTPDQQTLNTQSASLTPRDIEKINQLFLCSATLASQIEQLARDILHNEASTAALSVAMETLAQKVGFMSDQGSKIVGDPGVRGGAEAWLLPPLFHKSH